MAGAHTDARRTDSRTVIAMPKSVCARRAHASRARSSHASSPWLHPHGPASAQMDRPLFATPHTPHRPHQRSEPCSPAGSCAARCAEFSLGHAVCRPPRHPPAATVLSSLPKDRRFERDILKDPNDLCSHRRAATLHDPIRPGLGLGASINSGTSHRLRAGLSYSSGRPSTRTNAMKGFSESDSAHSSDLGFWAPLRFPESN